MTSCVIRAALIGMVVCLATLVARPSHAEDATDEQVGTWVVAGEKDYRAGRFAEAESWFEKAYAARADYDIAANLAAAELKQNKRAEAADHIRAALAGWPVTADSDLRATWKTKLAAAEAAIGRLRIETEAGATVTVDGIAVGTAPLEDDVYVEPGAHRVEARLGERVAFPSDVAIEAGATQLVTLKLSPATNTTPTEDGWSLIPGWVVGAVGLVGIGVGVGLYVVASSNRDDAMTLSNGITDEGGACNPTMLSIFEQRCTSLGDKTSSIEALEDGGTAALAAGSALTVGAILYLLLAPSGEESDGTAIHMNVGPDTGLSLHGTF